MVQLIVNGYSFSFSCVGASHSEGREIREPRWFDRQ